MLEVAEEDSRLAVGVVVRLPESTFGFDRLPTTPTVDVPVPSGSVVEERPVGAGRRAGPIPTTIVPKKRPR
eukprot:11177224-Lingulodinium_polyedra.AAC.1